MKGRRTSRAEAPQRVNNLAMKKFLVISVLGKDRPGIVNDMSKMILDNGGNLEDSRMTVLGGEFAMILLVSGNWANIAKIESGLPKLATKLDLTILVRSTEPREVKGDLVPYLVDVICMDHPGVVHEVAEFFATRQINIEELSTWTYPAAHTGTPMFSLSMTVSIPSNQHIGQLRQDFTSFCDDLNLDATLEPARH